MLSRVMCVRRMSTRVAKSINPHNGAVEKEYPLWSDAQATLAADKAAATFLKWKKSSFAERGVMLNKAAVVLRARKGEFSKMMAIEMGKPLAQGHFLRSPLFFTLFSLVNLPKNLTLIQLIN